MILSCPVLLSIAAFTCFTFPARAEIGPCKQDEKREVLICGSGNGAAIVIRDTPSPSQRLALAWRTPEAPPTAQPDWDRSSFWSCAWLTARSLRAARPSIGTRAKGT